jgi:hypothetical protein
MLLFSVTELDEASAAAAWPLARMVAPELNPKQWQESTQAIRQRGGGILGVEVANSGLMGVATYEVLEKPSFGRTLHVANFVAFELSRTSPVKTALAGALKQLASVLDCSQTVIEAAKRPKPGWASRTRSRTRSRE